METIKATLWIYRIALKRSAQLMRENWAVVFAPFAYSVFLSVASIYLIPLGMIGRLLLVLASSACMSSGLYLLENILNSRKADFKDFLNGFKVYLLDIVRIAFILWIPWMLASSVLDRVPDGLLLLLFIALTLCIIMNAVPELIYQSRASGLEVLVASYHFTVENWIEWLAPNLPITVTFIFMFILDPITLILLFPMGIFILLVFGVLLSYLMIFRGLLFSELNGSNRRGRIYRYKARDST